MFACVKVNLSAVPEIGTVWRPQKWGLQTAPKMGPSGGPQIRPLPSQCFTELSPLKQNCEAANRFWARWAAPFLGSSDGPGLGAAGWHHFWGRSR